MSPTHTNKQGARYRYYVSHALLQNRKAEAGSIARVPAPEIESLMCNGVRRHLGSMAEAGPPTALADRDLIERHVARVIVTPQALEVRLNPAGEQAEDPSASEQAPCRPPITIKLPWIAPSFVAIKGILHAPYTKPAMNPKGAMLCSPQSPRPEDGSRTSGSAALSPSLRSPSMKPRANGTSACLLPSPFCRPASLPQSSMPQRLRILRLQVSPKPCPIRGPSRSERIGLHL